MEALVFPVVQESKTTMPLPLKVFPVVDTCDESLTSSSPILSPRPRQVVSFQVSWPKDDSLMLQKVYLN